VKGRILVADDDPASLDLLQAFLESRGYEVTRAADGNHAVELGSDGDFDLAVIDVHMPVYEGVEVVELLRRRHLLHPLKVIALTGDVSRSLHLALAAAGIDSYLTKPVELSELESEVTRLTAATRSA